MHNYNHNYNNIVININKLFKLMNIFNLSLMVDTTYIPPVGSHYKGSVKLNYLGKQTINLYQLEPTTSYIVLNGLINHDGYIYYVQNDNSNSNEIVTTYKLDSSTQYILDTYKSKIIDARYIKQQDICQIIVTNYLIYVTKTIKLFRVND